MERRIRKPNSRYYSQEWINGNELSQRASRVSEKLWEIEDVLDRRPSSACEGDEVLVRWKGDWPDSWVCLLNNPELEAYLSENSANPHSSCLAATLRESATGTQYEYDLRVLRQQVFDALGEPHSTPEGNQGYEVRTTVTVPFTAESFERNFRSQLPQLPKAGNVRGCLIPVSEIIPILGEDISVRPSSRTSTEMRLNPHFMVRLKWGYQKRVTYDHTNCPRCSWCGSADERPSRCQPTSRNLPSEAMLSITFSKHRVNTLACK